MNVAETKSGAPTERWQQWLAVGLLWLVWGHFTDRVPPPWMGVPEPAALVCHLGKFGIYIGFGVFGYLFERARSRSGTLSTLWADGLARLWPLLVAASLLIFVVTRIVPPPVVPDGPKAFNTEVVHLVDILGSLLFLEDLGFSWADGAFWPLLIVVKFWILTGIAAWLIRDRYVVPVIIAAILLGTAVTALEYLSVPGTGLVQKALNGLLIASYLPYFAAGLVIASPGVPRRWLIPLGAVIIAHGALTIAHIYHFDWTSTGIVLLVTAATVAIDLLSGRRVLGFVGRFAYAWFLIHQIIGLILIKALAVSIGIDAAIAVGIAATLALSVALSLSVEGPCYRLLREPLQRLFGKLGLARRLTGARETRSGDVPQPG